MTKTDKLKAIAHIRTMLAEDGNDDEINVRVWCVLNGFHPPIWLNGAEKPDGEEWVKYTTDLNALRDIQDEGWVYNTSHIFPWDTEKHYIRCDGYHQTVVQRINVAVSVRAELPIFERAHLDAILQTFAWRVENE